MARRDFRMCLHYGCFELGIELISDSVNIRECRDHLQKKVACKQFPPDGPINQRASVKASARVDVVDVKDKDMTTPELVPPEPRPSFGSLLSSSSSDLTMPELAESDGDETESAASILTPQLNLAVPSTFAQSVRSELELLAE